MKLSHKKNDIPVTKILVISWILFSVYFIARTLWFNGLALTYQKGLQDGATQGYAKAFSDVATAASNKACQPFPLNLGTDNDGKPITISLINVNCLQQSKTVKAVEENMEKNTEK